MFERMSFATQMIIYVYSIIVSIGAYILCRGESKEERKQCIVFQLGMGVGMFLLQKMKIGLLIIAVELLVSNKKRRDVISIIATSYYQQEQ